MDNPAKFNMENPNMMWDEMLKLHYCFVMCEPNGQRWGQWGMWKCSCDEGFKDAICGHSTLLTLLFDKTLSFPQELPRNTL